MLVEEALNSELLATISLLQRLIWFVYRPGLSSGNITPFLPYLVILLHQIIAKDLFPTTRTNTFVLYQRDPPGTLDNNITVICISMVMCFIKSESQA